MASGGRRSFATCAGSASASCSTGAVNEWLLARTLRAGAVSPQAWSQPAIAAAWQQFDQGTQRAILRLHRSIEPAGLAAAGAELRELWAPTLVLWGAAGPVA